ncbi:MAG: outer membrane beta-barrel protein [Burkholderiales bacterium]
MKRVLLLLVLFTCGPALAQTSGWYFGGGIGITRADFVRSDFTALAPGAAYAADDDDFSGRIFGGYRVAPNFAIEAGSASLGSYRHRYSAGGDIAVLEYDASALTIAAAGKLPIAGGFSLNGRVGIAFTAAELREKRNDNDLASIPFCPDSWWYSDCTSSSTNLYWGLGAQYDVGPRWGIRLDYDNYGEVGEEFETGRAYIETISVSFVWRF